MDTEETKAAAETRSCIQLKRRLIIDDTRQYYEFCFSDRPDEVFQDVEELYRSRGLSLEEHGYYIDLGRLGAIRVTPEPNLSPEPNKTMPEDQTEIAIAQTKQLRKELDEVLQNLRRDSEPIHDGIRRADHVVRASRERSLALTKIQEAIMWLGMDLKDLGTPNPYPTSYDPTSSEVEPTADGLKL